MLMCTCILYASIAEYQCVFYCLWEERRVKMIARATLEKRGVGFGNPGEGGQYVSKA